MSIDSISAAGGILETKKSSFGCYDNKIAYQKLIFTNSLENLPNVTLDLDNYP